MNERRTRSKWSIRILSLRILCLSRKDNKESSKKPSSLKIKNNTWSTWVLKCCSFTHLRLMFSCKNACLNLLKIKNLATTTLLICNAMKMFRPEGCGVNFRRRRLSHLKNSMWNEGRLQVLRSYNLLRRELKIKIYKMSKTS
jgi:hypothetical protein